MAEPDTDVDSLDPAANVQGLPLERFRQYLMLMARMQLGGEARHKLEASDIVQQALLDAHRKRDQFRGHTEAELAAWLRQILSFGLVDAFRAQNRANRNVERERPIDLNASSARLEALLVADHSSPSQRADRFEQVLRMAECLARLPEGQREVLVLRHCHGWTFLQISEHLGCTVSTAAGLLKRGSEKLKSLLEGPASNE